MKFIADALLAKSIDDIAINRLKVESVVLMERAAKASADIIDRNIDNRAKVASVCGKGNNGGDAIGIACILSDRGYNVDIYMFSEKDQLSPESRIQYEKAAWRGIKIIRIDNRGLFDANAYDVIIDGIFGIGLSKPVSGLYYDIIHMINESHATIFSVDVPSGIHSTYGSVLGIAIEADITITFGLNKAGLILYPGALHAGRVIVCKEVFPQEAYNLIHPSMYIYDMTDLCLVPERSAVSNKGTYGHVLIIAGSKGMSGAAYLSAKAAYRTGCGLVKIITHEDNRIILQTQLPEAIINTYDKIDDIDILIDDNMSWADCVVAGPGIGMSDISERIVKRVIDSFKVPVILDADALNILAKNNMYTDSGYDHSNIILTPHLKEMSRLLQGSMTPEYIHDHIIDIAREYTYNDVVIVLKDARTVVCDGRMIYINTSGNDGMATGGSGDVLTGVIAGLIAQGADRFDAAKSGVQIHGLAGDHAAAVHGRYSMTAGDITDCIECVLREIE